MYVTSSLEMQEDPMYACLSSFICILPSTDIHRMVEMKEVIISVGFLNKNMIIVFSEQNSYLHV